MKEETIMSKKTRFEVTDDCVIKEVLEDVNEDGVIVKSLEIMPKDIFIECYKKWILQED